ncbi:mannitol-1-phosphate 5-dehydrogenase [Agromyces sp. SYSU T00194]|uniref:mannitol-1-phosphate 5-dehydrogenase n=1 Tax=Agromyces chitinivorans TaxID=3158560 RepID=UPI0033953F50
MQAVHFGAGNIGRGFVGLLLHEAGYEVVFADVNAELIDALAAADSYEVHAVGASSTTTRVDGFRAVNSASDPDRVVSEIASADVLTTAVGPNILRFIAPHLLAGLRARPDGLPPLQVMACENAINATDLLHDETAALCTPEEWTGLAKRAVFANTAVDRIVPGQDPDAGLDVTVETFFEWAIERGPFGDAVPAIPGAHFVDDLAPYIERKLFTVNTGHASIAYFGFIAGHHRIAEALADPVVEAAVAGVLEETSALLVAKHEFAEEAQTRYRETILERFRNEALPDTVERVGRQPIRKLGRHERFVGPAAELVDHGMAPRALLDAMAAALRFDVPSDEQSVELQRMLREESAEAIVADVTGLAPTHPLSAPIVERVRERQSA